MDAHSCCCCLQCSPDKDLTTPYTHLGKTEIYSDMLKYCFDINLVNGLGSCGICSTCVERLRDANNFKQQVQSNQAAMLAKLHEYSLVKAFAKESANNPKTQDDDEITDKPALEEPQVKFELFTIDDDQDETKLLPEEQPVKQEINMELMFTQPIKTEVSDEGACEKDRDSITSDGRCTAEDTVSQDVKLSLPCSVNLERVAIYSCDICSKHFGAKTALIRHIKTHYECNKCKGTFLTDLCLNRHTKLHICKTCCKVFPDIKKLERHEINYCDKPYPCYICSKRFKSKRYVTTHIGIIHSSTKIFNCSSCSYSTRLKPQLKRHFIAHHSLEKRYRCNQCNYFSTDKTNLWEHMSTHTGTNPFECSVCDFKTAKKHFLSSHIKTHTDHKPFRCHICSYRCRDENNLLVHLLTHSAGNLFKCDLCDKKFLNSQSLRDHQAMHRNDVIQFKCSKCVYQTDRKHNLIRHDTLAHSEKPLHCDQCDYKGSNEQQLTRHIQQHRNKNRLIHVYIKGSEIVSDTVLI